MTSSSSFSDALSLHRAGRLDAAEVAYRKDLAEIPGDAKLLHGLGVLLAQRGDLSEAEELIVRAIELRPAEATYCNSLGNVFQQRNLLPKAEEQFRKAISIQPRLAPAHINLGNTLQLMGRMEESLAAYHAALAINPNDARTYIQLGSALLKAGRVTEAIPRLENGLALDPDSVAAHAAYAEALERSGEYMKAEERYRILTSMRPAWGEAWNNLGRTLLAQGRHADALAPLEQGLLLAPSLPELHHNLGVAWMGSDRFERAVDSFERLASIRPDSSDAWRRLGHAQLWAGDVDGAVASLRRAILLDPTNAEAHGTLGLALLTAGDFQVGWAEYEWRWRAASYQPMRTFPAPLWDGKHLRQNETLLLHSEQGFGDAIQFVRYAHVLAQRGQRVIIECQDELVRLFRSSLGGIPVYGRNEPLPAFDAHCPMMSLPHRLGTTVESIPADVPYLAPEATGRANWRKRLDALPPGPRVGVAWAGKPDRYADHVRSLTLEQLWPLLALQEINWVSLQLGTAATQVRPAGTVLHDFTSELADFADTASLIANLDLVIAVDTAVAHLAGALAVATWVLLPSVDVWRWMRNRRDSPWYPTIRLFRQRGLGNWQPVISEVAETLRNTVQRSAA